VERVAYGLNFVPLRHLAYFYVCTELPYSLESAGRNVQVGTKEEGGGSDKRRQKCDCNETRSD
jgi:hypothetical protein